MKQNKTKEYPTLIEARKRYEKSKEIALLLVGYKYTDAIEILDHAKAHLLGLAEIVPSGIEGF